MSSDDEKDPRGVSRRHVLGLSAAALGGAVVGGIAVWGGGQFLENAHDAQDGEKKDAGDDEPKEPALRRFVSTALTIAAVQSWRKPGATPASGYLFASPRTDMFTGGILDDDGEPVWIAPTGVDTGDVRVQTYRGKPVLTYWAGHVGAGNGQGTGYILDNSYRQIAVVRAGAGCLADLHEFTLTDRDTALVTAYPIVRTDLRPLGGPRDGYMYGCRVQEIDVATGKVLLDWDMLAHVPLDESAKRIDDDTTGADAEHAFDPFHINSADAAGDRLLVSARHTSALYALDRRTGEVLWRLGGSASDFTIPDDAAFSWQHDARWHGPDRISLFDNNGVKGDEGISAGLILAVDESAKSVTLDRAFRYGKYKGYAMGNTQLLEDGSVLVGWGSAPAATEFTADGEAVFGLTELGTGSYRVYRHAWTGKPAAPPAVAAQADDDGTTRAYMSWNGATDVASWRLLAGPSEAKLSEVATAKRTGFETSIAIPASADAAVIRAEARDSGGAVLGSSAIVALRAAT
ncbi:Arylsulfotransferase (ASST) [Paramicrobacterium humi]|uniref:Arylsulfotransferase (ASST) n=1 Tax=Paramicrobacterium humi TaxID=640635 RepID=A0A1H4Q0F0_9MICO|nr:arylsulfotransferase family protein [Microbacterium humi]SEC13010.1 Arylsulfotransferase (ASST) [Microbacterium humi]